MACYDDTLESPMKQGIREEFAEMAREEMGNVLILDGEHCRQSRVLIEHGFPPSSIYIVERHYPTYQAQKRNRPKGVHLIYAQCILKYLTQSPISFSSIFYDGMGSTLDEMQLKSLRGWITKEKKRKSLFICLSMRGKEGMEQRVNMIQNHLTTSTFSFYSMRAYQQSENTAHMAVLVFRTCPRGRPFNPLYQPRRIRRRVVNGFDLVQWYGLQRANSCTFWLCFLAMGRLIIK